VLPVPEPLFVIVPVLLSDVVVAESELLVDVLFFNIKLPVPDEPPVRVNVPAVLVIVVPLVLLGVIAPLTVSEYPELVIPVTLDPTGALIVTA
jgi:hypothetical protein